MGVWSKQTLLNQMNGNAKLFDAWTPTNIVGRGEAVQLYLCDGLVQIVDLPVTHMVPLLEKRFTVDGKARKEAYKSVSGKSQNYPVVVGGQLFVAIQYREKPEVPHDPCMGFCDAFAIRRYDALKGGGTRIHLKSTLWLDSVWSVQAIHSILGRGHLFHHNLVEQGIIQV